MAAKLLHSLTDDNLDLQKQIGCMTGAFQLFDRHHIPAGRRIAGHSPTRLPSGSSHFNNGTLERESSNIHQRPHLVDKHSNKNVQDKHRVSTESSRASFSSLSRSSSFSSLDCNKTTQPEPLSFDQTIFLETPSRDPSMNQPSASPQLGRQSLDLRDVVKDSMYREARGLSPKTTSKDRDSPRPLQLSKYSDMDLNAKQNFPMDFKESLSVLAKLREAPWYLDEPRELSRSKSYQLKDGSSFSISKDAPRFSYDGREINHLSFESRDNSKATQKPQDLPRLSLDSRESSMPNLNPDSLIPNKNSDSKSNILSRNRKRNNVISFNEGLGPIVPEMPGTLTRPLSVVAKLMGLDTLPDSALATDTKLGLGPISTHSVEDVNSLSRSSKYVNSLSRSSKATDFCGPIRMPNSSRSSPREPTSPRWKNPDTVMKPISRFPMETAPWKQRDGSRSPRKSASRQSPAKAHSNSPFSSVYSEIEERLKYLEFTQSGKDLRALKQILEAMQSVETRKGGRQDSHFIATPNSRFSNQGKQQGDQVTLSANRGLNSSRAFESPIVIMKPANKLVEKSGASKIRCDDGFADNKKVSVHNRIVKDHIPKNSRNDNGVNFTDMKSGGKNTRYAQISSRKQQLSKESTTSSGKSSGSVSPRLQQKKLELEKQSRPPTPPSDSSKPRKQSNKQQSESSSPGGRRRPKYSNFQQSDDQCSEISDETRKLGYQPNLDIVLNSKIDIEVPCSEMSEEIDSLQSPSMKATDFSPSIQKKSTPALREDESPTELAMVAPEYASPVSVLDDAVYVDDSPSPVKHMMKTLKADAMHNPNDQWEAADGEISETIRSGITSEINRKKLQNIEHLVQKLRRLNSGHDEARTDYIASLCENTNPDHRYISEILLASGLLLRDLGSNLTTFQFHSSGHPINPELFLVLEQTKSSNLLKEECGPDKLVQKKFKKEKFHRKLIFDTVNEILVGKLGLVGHILEPWSRPFKLARKTLNAQQLLRDLCLEIEELHAKKTEFSGSLEEEDDSLKSILWEDVNHRSESWTNYNGEMPVMVLEVERLIFKDLVNEVVIGEASGRRVKPSRRCRQLFAK